MQKSDSFFDYSEYLKRNLDKVYETTAKILAESKAESTSPGEYNWSSAAVEAKSKEVNAFSVELGHLACFIAKGKDTKTITDSDVRDARRRLMAYPVKKPWQRFIARVGVYSGGLLTAYGIKIKPDIFVIVAGVVLSMLSILIEEIAQSRTH